MAGLSHIRSKALLGVALISFAAMLGWCVPVQAQSGADVNVADFVTVEDLVSTETEDSLALEKTTADITASSGVQVDVSGIKAREEAANRAAAMEVPLTLSEAEALEADISFEEDESQPFDLREEALKEAAISYGARAGLAWRTYYIRREMDRRARSLDRIYDFRQLLIPAPSGLLIEPPIISENVNSMIIEGDGQQAAVSDRIYNIMNNAKIVSSARTWRTYLERSWGKVDPPPDILRPRDDEERALWIKMVRRGWKEGVQQANEIFEQDLSQLVSDFEGMIRYRMLLSQGMISAPYALQVDRGVTGGGDEMRVGDRAVQITGKPSLMTGYDTWQPASR